MKCFSVVVIALTTAFAVCGQTAEVLKGHLFRQTGDAAPLPMDGQAFEFRATFPSLGLESTFSKTEFTAPGGATRPLTFDGDESFAFRFATNSATSLNTTFGTGSYSFKAVNTFMGTLTPAVMLGLDAYPAAPRLKDLAGAQALDVTKDQLLVWDAFAGGTDADTIAFMLQDQAGNVVFARDGLGGTETAVSIFADQLGIGQTYTATLTFTKITTNDLAMLPPVAAGFFAQTVFTLKTAGGGPDLTPPGLSFVNPADGSTDPLLSQPVTFLFNEPMRTDHSVSWSTNIDATKIVYHWVDESSLVCFYDGQGGSFPANRYITWTLNAVPGAASNFRDLAGNELPKATGRFSAGPPGTDPGGCHDSGLPSGAGQNFLLLTKQVAFVQTGESPPVEDPVDGTIFAAFFLADTNALPASVSLRIPSVPVRNRALPGSTFLAGYFTLIEPRAGAADLEAAYPAGSYVLTVRATDGSAPTLSVAVGSTTAESVPQFVDTASAKAIDATKPFTLRWLPGTGGTNHTVTLEIVELNLDGTEGAQIYLAPDSCHGVALANTAGTVSLPARTFRDGHDYVAKLTFSTATLPVGTGTLRSLTQLSRQTRLKLHAGSGAVVPPRTLTIFNVTPDGFSLSVDSVAGLPLLIERAPTPSGPWETVLNLPSVLPDFTSGFDYETLPDAFFRVRQ